jgi:response regulator RpfG family c-di-GMP phosphodiesterase
VFAVSVGSALLAALFALGSVALFARAGLFVSCSSPLIVMGASFVTLFMARYTIEKRRANNWLRQLENARQITIESMASVAETRDPETGAHIKRTQNYVRAIARELAREGHYLDVLTPEYIELLYISAPLHDIGKVGVPDHILLKPGRLTPDEMEIMKQHAEYGRRIIVSTSQHIDGDNFLQIAGEIAATHHERWDGGGYPVGLRGPAIPLSGRIMAVADIYDALISRRCYKEPYTHEHSTRIMRDLRAKTFDPVVIDAFFRIEAQILDIAARFRDEEELAALPAAALAPTPAPLPESVSA